MTVAPFPPRSKPPLHDPRSPSRILGPPEPRNPKPERRLQNSGITAKNAENAKKPAIPSSFCDLCAPLRRVLQLAPETRNPNEALRQRATAWGAHRHSDFGFRASFGFRPSDFGFGLTAACRYFPRTVPFTLPPWRLQPEKAPHPSRPRLATGYPAVQERNPAHTQRTSRMAGAAA